MKLLPIYTFTDLYQWRHIRQATLNVSHLNDRPCRICIVSEIASTVRFCLKYRSNSSALSKSQSWDMLLNEDFLPRQVQLVLKFLHGRRWWNKYSFKSNLEGNGRTCRAQRSWLLPGLRSFVRKCWRLRNGKRNSAPINNRGMMHRTFMRRQRRGG